MTVFLVLWTVSLYFFFLCEQKTAYEMRISDWSSDVCSSDLAGAVAARHPAGRIRRRFPDVALSHRRHQHRRPEGTPAAAPPAGDGCPAGRGGTQPQRSAGRGRTRRRYVPDSARRVHGGSSEGPAAYRGPGGGRARLLSKDGILPDHASDRSPSDPCRAISLARGPAVRGIRRGEGLGDGGDDGDRGGLGRQAFATLVRGRLRVDPGAHEIGSASCWERGGQDG